MKKIYLIVLATLVGLSFMGCPTALDQKYSDFLNVGFVVGDMTGNDFTAFTSVEANNFMYEFTYSNDMKAWGGGNGTLNFKITTVAGWTGTGYGIGDAPLTLNGNAVDLKDGGENITVEGLSAGQKYVITVTTTSSGASAKIAGQVGEKIFDDENIALGFIKGTFTDGIKPLVKEGHGLYTYEFKAPTDSSSLTFAVLPTDAADLAGKYVGATLTAEDDPVSLSLTGPDIVLSGITAGDRYRITVMSTKTAVYAMVNTLKPINAGFIAGGLAVAWTPTAMPIVLVAGSSWAYDHTQTALGDLEFKMTGPTGWDGDKYGLEDPLILGAEPVETVIGGNPPNIKVKSLPVGEYRITVTSTPTKVFVKIAVK